MLRSGAHPKIKSTHLQRLAYIYVRQSTAKQVSQHLESQQYQRRLADRAESLGWAKERIQIIDNDLAQSARSSTHRAGFQELVAEVSLGHVGIIFSYEVSRLARNNSDWYHLLDLAAVFDTLIADNDGIYHPRLYNDRLLLGLKGTMSEAELHLLQQRMEEGRLNQVRRGEYRQRLPTGLLRQLDGRVVKDPDIQVQHAIQMVLDQFARLGSGGKVMRYLRKEQVLLPGRRSVDIHTVVWRVASESAIREIVTNPAYAGTFVYGRRQTDPIRKIAGRANSGLVRKPMNEWIHIQHHCYPAYISWDQYLKNQAQLQQNATLYPTLRVQAQAQGAVRQGEALLQGLVVCGCCGHHMPVHYKGRSSYSYRCVGLRRTLDVPPCFHIDGSAVDELVRQAFFEALKPAHLDALEEILQAQQQQHQQLAKQWQQRLQRAEYEVRLAERQYQAVDPENRLVAAELEQRWEQTLRERREVQEGLGRFQQRPLETGIPSELSQRFRAICQHLPELWPNMPNEDKKALVRSLVKSVIMVRPSRGRVQLKVVWVSGHYTNLCLQPPILNSLDPMDQQALTQRIQQLWEQGLNDREIAGALKQEGFRSARSAQVSPLLVQQIRLENQWKSALERSKHADEVDGRFTIGGLARHLGVTHNWVYNRIRNGVIPATCIQRHPQGKVHLLSKDGAYIEQLQAIIKAKSDH